MHFNFYFSEFRHINIIIGIHRFRLRYVRVVQIRRMRRRDPREKASASAVAGTARFRGSGRAEGTTRPASMASGGRSVQINGGSTAGPRGETTSKSKNKRKSLSRVGIEKKRGSSSTGSDGGGSAMLTPQPKTSSSSSSSSSSNSSSSDSSSRLRNNGQVLQHSSHRGAGMELGSTLTTDAAATTPATARSRLALSSNDYYSPTVASTFSSLLSPGSASASTSPAALLARSVAAGLRGSRDREATEEKMRSLIEQNKKLEEQLSEEQRLSTRSVASTSPTYTTKAISPSSPSPPPSSASPSHSYSALDRLLATAHQVRSIQERELSYTTTPSTNKYARGSVQSLLTTLARDRDKAKEESKKMSDVAHELRLELSKVSGQLAECLSDKERLESEKRQALSRADGFEKALRSLERDSIVQRAEVTAQRDEASGLRKEVSRLRNDLHKVRQESRDAEKSKGEIRDRCDALKAENASLTGSVELGVQEAAALRDTISQLTSDCDAARKE